MLIHWMFDDFLIPNKGGLPKIIAVRILPVFIPKPVARTLGPHWMAHVIGVWNPKVRIKPLAGGQKFRLVPQVPFTHTGSGIPLFLKKIGDRGFLWVKAHIIAGK